MRGYVGRGRIHRRSAGDVRRRGRGEIPQLQNLLRYICENGFEHHVAANLSDDSRAAVYEADSKYLGWEMYWH